MGFPSIDSADHTLQVQDIVKGAVLGHHNLTGVVGATAFKRIKMRRGNRHQYAGFAAVAKMMRSAKSTSKQRLVALLKYRPNIRVQ